jgi:hypothetical protein
MSSCNEDTLYGHDPCLVKLIQTNEILNVNLKISKTENSNLNKCFPITKQGFSNDFRI